MMAKETNTSPGSSDEKMAATVEFSIEHEGTRFACHLAESEYQKLNAELGGAETFLKWVVENKSRGLNLPQEMEKCQDDTTTTTNKQSGSKQKSAKTGQSIWNKATVRLLLSLVQEGKEKFKNPHVKKKDFWQETAQKMNTKGKNVSGYDVNKKFYNLYDTYKKCKNKERTEGEDAITWDYYHDFASIYEDDDPGIITSDLQPSASIPSVDSESSSASTSSVVPQESPVSTFRRGSKKRLRADSSSQPNKLTVVDVLDLGRQQRAEFIDIAKQDLAMKGEMLALAKEKVGFEKAKVQAEEKSAAEISSAIRYLADAFVKNK